MRSHAFALALSLTLPLAACSGDETPDASTFVDPDVGFVPRDTGVAADAAPLDSGGTVDTGVEPDAGFEPDSGPTDAGPGPDSGPTDAGPGPDSGPADAAVEPDSGPADAGLAPDAQVDAGAPVDAGPDAGPPADAAVDAGPADTGPLTDAGVDAGPADTGLPPTPAYTIDGDLTEWTAPISVLVNPGYNGSGLWGPDNRFEELRVDGDANFLYLGFAFRASGNSAIIHMDTVPGGVSSAAMLNAWPRLMSFATGSDHFVAQYEGGALQLRDLVSPTNAPDSTATWYTATTSNGVARVTEAAIPWSALGYTGPGPYTVTFFAGILGGDTYGGGDMAPNANSVPIATGNTIGDSAASFAQTFAQGFTVTIP